MIWGLIHNAFLTQDVFQVLFGGNILYSSHLQSMTDFLSDYNSRINNVNNHDKEIYFMVTTFLNLSVVTGIGYVVLPGLRLYWPVDCTTLWCIRL